MAINFLNNAIGTAATFTGDLKVAGGLLFADQSSTRVGIGTLFPDELLHVDGPCKIRGLLKLDQNNNSTFAGVNAGNLTNIIGSKNTAFGRDSLSVATSNSNNVAVGFEALKSSNTGNNNVAIGAESMSATTDSNGNNVAIGYQAAKSTNGARNVAIGAAALLANVNGIQNTAIGDNALSSLTSNGNTALGYQAGSNLTNAQNNVIIGYQAQAGAATAQNQIVIGKGAVGDTTNNSVVIGNDAIAKTILKGNVGIGNTNPGAKLQVSSGTSAETTLIVGASGTIANVSSRIFLNEGENGVTDSKDYGFSLAYDGTGSDYGLPANTFGIIRHDNNSTGAVVLSAQRSTGNVGIGTTNPQYKLDVQGDLALTEGNEVYGLISPLQNRQGMQIAVGDPAYKTAPLVTFQGTDQRVGIGTTTPAAKLEISSGAPRIRLRDTTTGVSSGSTTGAIDFYTSDSSSEGNAVNAKIESYADSIYGRLGLRFFTGGGGAPTQAMTVNWVGSVGIGTTTPGYKLDVSGNGKFSNTSEGSLIIKHNYGYQRPNWAIKLDGDASTSGGYLSQYINQGGFALNQGGTYYGGGPHRTDTNSTSYSSVAGVSGVLAFYTDTSLTASTNFTPSERMRIDSSGNVGIGETSPTAKLHVDGGTTIASVGDFITKSNTVFALANPATKLGIGYNASDNPILQGFNVNGAKNIGLQVYGGSVGIGTASPESKLHVSVADVGVRSTYGTATIESEDAQLDLVSSSGGTWGSCINLIQGNGTTNTNVWSIARTTSGSDNKLKFNFGTANSHVNDTKVTFTEGGNVGIGTTSPSELLHLSSTGPARILIEADTDNATETDNAQIILKQDSGLVVGNLGYKTNTNSIEVWNEYAENVIFGTSNAERMRISANGNVGIGTTSPSTKLNVDGDIKIEGTGALFLGGAGVVPDWQISASTNDITIANVGGNSGSVFFNNSYGVAFPRLTTTQINAMPASVLTQGLMAYNITLNTICFYNGSSWQKVSHSNM